MAHATTKGPERVEFMERVKQDLAYAMATGQIFVINMDDSEAKYNEIYDPNIRDFFSPECFPSWIFMFDKLVEEKVYGRVLEDTEYAE